MLLNRAYSFPPQASCRFFCGVLLPHGHGCHTLSSFHFLLSVPPSESCLLKPCLKQPPTMLTLLITPQFLISTGMILDMYLFRGNKLHVGTHFLCLFICISSTLREVPSRSSLNILDSEGTEQFSTWAEQPGGPTRTLFWVRSLLLLTLTAQLLHC